MHANYHNLEKAHKFCENMQRIKKSRVASIDPSIVPSGKQSLITNPRKFFSFLISLVKIRVPMIYNWKKEKTELKKNKTS